MLKKIQIIYSYFLWPQNTAFWYAQAVARQVQNRRNAHSSSERCCWAIYIYIHTYIYLQCVYISYRYMFIHITIIYMYITLNIWIHIGYSWCRRRGAWGHRRGSWCGGKGRGVSVRCGCSWGRRRSGRIEDTALISLTKPQLKRTRQSPNINSTRQSPNSSVLDKAPTY